MPVKPGALLFICSQCGWKKCTYPSSDARDVGSDAVEQCGRCSSSDLEVHMHVPDRQPVALKKIHEWLRQRLS